MCNELHWWQIGSFGAITRIINIVPKREDLLKVALAGPVAGFSLGFLLLLVGFILPPADGLGIVVDASVFHESLLIGGLGSYRSQNDIYLLFVLTCFRNKLNHVPKTTLAGLSFSIG